MIRIILCIAIGFLVFILGCALFQRKFLYYPTHREGNPGLAPWQQDGRLIGYAREVPAPKNVWLLLHGNGGQASDRVYALPSFSREDSVFVLEYPGYGLRPGAPSMDAFNAAAMEAYELLRSRFPKTPVCVAGESIGSGPASALAKHPHPPDKIVLVVPFDILSRVASDHFPAIPVSLVLRDNWNNIESLKGYKGPVEIFGARDDTIIPVRHARALAESRPSARVHEIEGGHNDWAGNNRVAIRNP
jgi:uncharacterized protein